MSDEHNSALLIEINERQKSMQAELANMAAAYAQALEKYYSSDLAYREQLERHSRELEVWALGRKLAVVFRLIALLLLIFVAYHVY